MVYGCGNKCVKYSVFLFNFLVFVIGIAVLALSLSIRFSNEVQKYFQNLLIKGGSTISLEHMYIPLYVLAAIGSLLILTGFLGCCGAWCENTCLLAIFFSIILILFVAELACGIALFVNKDKIRDEVFKGVGEAFKTYSTDNEVKDSIDSMQQQMKCCGCTNATVDYTKLGNNIPPSCHENNDPSKHIFDKGCCQKVWDEGMSQIGVVAGIAIGILVIELLAMIFSCILCQAFRRGDYQYA